MSTFRHFQDYETKQVNARQSNEATQVKVYKLTTVFYIAQKELEGVCCKQITLQCHKKPSNDYKKKS